MKITAVSTAVVEANFDYTLVQVVADDGTYGIGECFFAPGLPSMAREIGSLLVGRDPRDIKTLTSRLHQGIAASSGPGSAGAALHAVSGLETALWDLLGKIWGEPVWRLLGGRFRDSVPVYADLHAGDGLGAIDSLLRAREPFWSTDDGTTTTNDFYWTENAGSADVSSAAVLERVQEAGRAGYRCVKLDIDVFEGPRTATDATLSPLATKRIAEKALWLRNEVDDTIEIAYDCHWRFDVPTARGLISALEDASPLWLEDPVPPTSKSLAAVASASRTAIASGENAYLLEGIVDLASEGGLHVATPDIQKVGGIAEAYSIGQWAARNGIGFAPHCIASPLGFSAAAHVVAATPSIMYLEFHGSDLPFWNELVNEPVIINGRAPLSDRPGLGVTLNMDTVRRFSARGERVFGEEPPR